MNVFQKKSNSVKFQARVVTENQFEEVTKLVPGILPKKRELSPASESEAKPSKIRKQQSEVREPVKLTVPGGPGSGISELIKASYPFLSMLIV